jgi:hypothetical protein
MATFLLVNLVVVVFAVLAGYTASLRWSFRKLNIQNVELRTAKVRLEAEITSITSSRDEWEERWRKLKSQSGW